MDNELRKNLELIKTKVALVNGSPTSSTFSSTTDSLEAIRDAITTFSDGAVRVHDVIIYPAAIHQATTELTDDGSSPVFNFDTESTTANAEGTPGVHFSELINLDQEGTITVISIYAEFETETKFTVGGGDGTTAFSKIQISRDGGVSWVDLTDNASTVSATYVTRIRAGVGRWVTTIAAGVTQFGVRLVGWTNDSVGGGGRSSAESQIRTNSYVRLSLRKS